MTYSCSISIKEHVLMCFFTKWEQVTHVFWFMTVVFSRTYCHCNHRHRRIILHILHILWGQTEMLAAVFDVEQAPDPWFLPRVPLLKMVSSPEQVELFVTQACQPPTRENSDPQSPQTHTGVTHDLLSTLKTCSVVFLPPEDTSCSTATLSVTTLSA